MKVKILFFILIVIFFGCTNKNKNNEFNNRVTASRTINEKNHITFNVIDSIRGEDEEWFYILGRKKSDRVYSSIRIISREGDTLCYINKDFIKNINGNDWKNSNEDNLFFGYKISKKNEQELELLTVDSTLTTYGEAPIIHWNKSKKVFETIKWQ